MPAKLSSRALGIALGVLADQIFSDPKNHHPVAIFGNATAKLEKYSYADNRSAGVKHVALCLVPLGLAGYGLEKLTKGSWLANMAVTAVCTWAATGAALLANEGHTMAKLLAAEDLAGAREQLTHLCGRDPDQLDETELCRGAIESMAENTADAAVATIFWATLAGIPGILVHRGANTLDAMIGHKNAKYLNFGWAAASFDDMLDYLPARITGALTSLLAPSIGGDAKRTWTIVLRDHVKHPSPNGGWCESAMAGALGVQLGGTNIYYGNRVEHRGLLGDGPRPARESLFKAAKMVRRVTWTATGCAASLLSLAQLARRSGKRKAEPAS